MIEVQLIGDKELDTLLKEFPGRATRAMVRALNRAIASGRTLMVRDIAGDTGLKSTVVRKAMVMREATASNPEARLAASLKRIPLIDFGASGAYPSRGKGRGVSYRLRGSRGRLPNAFITMRGGHKGVFARVGKARMPIQERFGPSIGHVFGKYRPAGIARIRQVFRDRFRHEMGFAASQGTSE